MVSFSVNLKFINTSFNLGNAQWIVGYIISKKIFGPGAFNFITSIVANSYLLDNQKEFFTIWYKIGKISTRKNV